VTAAELDRADIGLLYRATRKRLSALVLDAGQAHVAVSACPGWSVHDVVAHLVAVVEDAMAGRLNGPPSDDFTAEQVARNRDHDVPDMVARWAAIAEPFEAALTSMRIWPAFIDVLAHEHDLRGALNRPAGRQSEEVLLASFQLLSTLNSSRRLAILVADRKILVGPDNEAELSLSTTPFEAFRFRLGRRSKAQMQRMAWSGDPEPVLGDLTIVGPSPLDIVE